MESMAVQQHYSVATELEPDPEEACEYVQVQLGSEVVAEKSLPQGIPHEVVSGMTQATEVYYLQADGSLVQGSELLKDAGLHCSTNINTGSPTLKDAARHLQAAAQHVALGELDLSTLPRQVKLLKSIQLEMADVQQPKTADQAANQAANQETEIPVNLHKQNSNLLDGRIFQLKTQAEHGKPKHGIDSAIKILVQQPHLSEKPKAKDANKKTINPMMLLNSQDFSQTVGKKNVSCNPEKLKKKNKNKKTLKVKTRSGRISRPPMHKAKDYKFIKTGTLAHSSPSDSDDYSELSGEDEDRKMENVSIAPQSFTVKHTLFQCETCEKSYMGKGGLLRHYRLYPSHGQMQSSEINVSTPSGNEVEKRSYDTQKTKASHLPKGPSCRGRQRRAGRGAARFGRPKKSLNSLSSYSDIQLKKAKMKEFLQQYEKEDIKELVLPYVTQFVSVYDFLLSKVEDDHPGKSSFPFIYKEFEQLHSMVELLAQEYLANKHECAEGPLEIKNHKVAESLGIKGDITGKYPSIDLSTSESKMHSETKQKHKTESSDDDMLPPSKVPRVEEDVSEPMDESGLGEMFSSVTDAGQAKGTCCHPDGTVMPCTGNENDRILGNSSEEIFCTTTQAKTQDLAGDSYWTKPVSADTSEPSHKTQVNSRLQESSIEHAVGTHTDDFEDHLSSKDNGNRLMDSELSECFLSTETHKSSFDQAICEQDNSELSFHSSGHADPVNNPVAADAITSEETVCLNESETVIIEAFHDEPTAQLLQANIINVQVSCLDGKSASENDCADQSGTSLTCGADGIVLPDQAILYDTVEADLSNCEYQAEGIILTNTGTTDMQIETTDTVLQMETN
ncbi:hypothetical protein XENTR_v10021749 [Xenopus tropicalis]|uniref:Zinc finger protein 839 n=1 Tax=Xenopus tropicalis TaxID=8364 RepID=A0A6I8RPV8_XENTR|nr:hypothetical protein XENTR_v10021749 [Xenopus tropicalis]KAE8586746.1 hypothetical protein XENTR_v10021749 [Xenopus tropicalis]